ncbi:MAG: FixH family protein [Chloroflexota bacterium]
MRKLILPHTLIVLSVLLAACGSPAPAGTAAGASVQIAVETLPSPAAMGDVELVLTITDGSGQPIEGATVDVSADHTDMTGMTMGGAATEQGAGKYAITANFSMSGSWMMTVYVRKGDIDYKEEIPLTLK